MTGRASHRRTRANIERAVNLGLPLRVGVIVGEGNDGAAARADLEALGVTRIKVDHVRAFGRAGEQQTPCMSDLCGRCGTVQAACGPNDDECSPGTPGSDCTPRN
jgi:hypothetical protein